MKNEIEFQGGMTSENGYPQQGGYEKFLEKPIGSLGFSRNFPYPLLRGGGGYDH